MAACCADIPGLPSVSPQVFAKLLTSTCGARLQLSSKAFATNGSATLADWGLRALKGNYAMQLFLDNNQLPDVRATGTGTGTGTGT